MHGLKTCWGPEAFSKMCKLKVLIIHDLYLQLPCGLRYLPNSLKVLEWSEYPLKSLPVGVKLEELVELKLHGSKIKQLWNGILSFEKLKFIDLSYSKDLIHTPNFFGVPNLERLILQGCSNLVKIHQSVGHLKELVVLNLKDCINLKYLPRKLETNSLEDLNLSGCSKVQKLLEFVESMKENKSMESLDLSGTTIIEVPSFVGGFQNLKRFSVSRCGGLRSKPWWNFWGYSIPMGLKLPPLSGFCMLRELDACHCNFSDESIPDLSYLPSLEILKLSGNNFRGNSIIMKLKFFQFSSGLSKLRELELNNCGLSDGSILNDLRYLSSLEILKLSGNNFRGNSIIMRLDLSKFSSGLPKLTELELNNCGLSDGSILDDLRYLPSLKRLRLSGNDFVDLSPGCFSNLLSLQLLNISCCSKLQSLPMFPSFSQVISAENCDLMEVFAEAQIWKKLMSNEVMDCTTYSFLSCPANEIPAWYDRQKDCPSIWKFHEYQDSITVDIPDCCYSSEWWGIFFCIIVKPSNNADLIKGRLQSDLSQESKSATAFCLNSTLNANQGGGFLLRELDYRNIDCNHRIILFVGTFCDFLSKIKRDGCNQFQLFFGAQCMIIRDRGHHVEKRGNLNISKCGWRVICPNEVPRKATIVDFENIPSNSKSSSRFNQ